MTETEEWLRERIRYSDEYEIVEVLVKDLASIADEIERLRAALGLMIPHVEHMVIEAEEAAKVDTKFIRNRLKKARAALGEEKE